MNFVKNILNIVIYSLVAVSIDTACCCLLCDNGMKIQKNHENLYCDDGDITQAKLFETANFYITIDNYPVCKDHILIVPKEHKFSYSVVELSQRYEFEAIVLTLSEITKSKKYGLFEHGSNMVGAEQKACGNSVYHAHMHFIPGLDMDQQEIIYLCTNGAEMLTISLQEGFKFEDFCFHKGQHETILDFLQKLPTKQPYLFCYYSNSQQMALCIPDSAINNGVPSQFFRRVFAEYFQKDTDFPFWNWKDNDAICRSVNFRKNTTIKTIEKFDDKEYVYQVFEKNLNLISKNE